MPQLSKQPLKKEISEKIRSIFFIALSQVKSQRSARCFYGAVFTPTEQIMFSKRFAAFYLLEKGVDRSQIASILKVSPSTVIRFHFWWKSLSGEQIKIIKNIMLKKEIKHLFVDTFKSIRYGPFLPKHTNWSRWRKEKNNWHKELKDPLR